MHDDSSLEALCPVGASIGSGAGTGDWAATLTLTTLEVATVTSVRVWTGVAYLAAPGGPVVYESVVCTDDV